MPACTMYCSAQYQVSRAKSLNDYPVLIYETTVLVAPFRGDGQVTHSASDGTG